MALYEVILRDGTVEAVDGADTYQQERHLTTFFRHGTDRRVVDSWATRLASFRTTDIVIIRRASCPLEDGAGFAHRGVPV